ncbi:hypothetical protein NQ314_009637 [Rhamnusium bicolor]|uniref:Uncharacterized protein n=1 Tax=Rhamnusium bicolor TaxID=1586634 RepID=A0AAV8XYT6_9CUCU|nr:hypothetical protein NQ314_009637 [Rhamnusium bicolor]
MPRRARVFYKGPTVTLCDICEDENCGNICKISAKHIKSRDNGDDGLGEGDSTINLQVTTWILVLSIVAMICR